MTIIPISLNGWRLPGCGVRCAPRRHDPLAHEAYGFHLALMAQRVAPQRLVRTGPLVVDLEACRVYVNGREIHLTGREWELLAYLAERCGQNCRSADIGAAIWGDAVPDANARNVNVHANRLRPKLGEAAYLLKTPRLCAPSLRRLDLVEST